MNPDITFIVAGAAALLFALGAAVAELRADRRHRELAARSARAEGVVQRLSMPFHRSRNKPTTEAQWHTVPVIRFRASDGLEYEFNAESAPREAGERVAVLYDPAQPSTAALAERRSRFGCAIVLALGSLAAFGWAFFGS